MMWLRVAAIAVGVFLVGCSFVPEKSDEQYHLADMLSLQQLDHWYLDGRLAYQDSKDSFSVSVNWRHVRDKDQITLSGPLSQGKVMITVGGNEVVVEDGNERHVYQGSVDEVVAEQLGFTMPVAALKYWVVGVYDPSKTYVEMADGIVQQGWTVKYREMQSVASQLMPKRMTVEQGQIKMKFLVDTWDLL